MKHIVLNRISNRICELILNRSDKRNALNLEMIALLNQHLLQLKNDDQLQLLVLRANGSHFSAGADLNWMKSGDKTDSPANLEDAQQLATLLNNLAHFPKATLCLVQGDAYGGALGLISCCNIVLCCQHCKFAFSEAKLGLVPAIISPYIGSAMGIRSMQRLFLTAETFSATEGFRLGLISELVSDTNELVQRYQTISNQLIKNGPNALIAIKKLCNYLAIPHYPQTTENYTLDLLATVRTGDEAQEGITAFFEKRTADWVDKTDE